MNYTNGSENSLEAYFSPSAQALLGSILFVQCCVGAVGNSVLCLIVYRHSAMRSAINLLLAAMALTDTLITLLFIPFDLVTVIANKWVLGSIFCYAHAFLLSVLLIANVSILVLISIDRYLIIVHRRDKLSTSRIRILLIISVCHSLLVCCPPLLGWGEYTFGPNQMHCHLALSGSASRIAYSTLYSMFFFLLPCALMLFAYFHILSAVRRTAVRVADQPEVHRLPNATATKQKRSRHLRIDFRFKTRTFSTILFLFLAAFVCKLPFAVALLVWSAIGEGSRSAHVWLLCLVYLNSAINPVIYAWKVAKYRKVVAEKLRYVWRMTGRLYGDDQRINPAHIYQISNQNQSSFSQV